MSSFGTTMALRLQLAPEAVRVLSGCQPALRERLLHELGAIFTGSLLDAGCQGPGADTSGACALPSGFHVRYALDGKQGLLHLLELQCPEEASPALAP
jgi:hypothetical protein